MLEARATVGAQALLSCVCILAFSGRIGHIWLATPPLTSGLMGPILGMRYLFTLVGIVYFSSRGLCRGDTGR